MADRKKRLSAQERLRLIQTLNALPSAQFGELVFALRPSSGILPGNAAPQGSRSAALLQWVESPTGPGLADLESVLGEIVAGRSGTYQPSASQEPSAEDVLREIIQTLRENQGPKYDFRGAQFAGGFAETVYGNQGGGTINNYGQSTITVSGLIRALREAAQSFPEDPQEEALMELDDLESDLAAEPPNLKRVGRRLQRLIAAGQAAGGAAMFSSTVLQLAEQVGVDKNAIRPP